MQADQTNVEDESILPPGRYYVGDLSHVFSDEQWEEMCNYVFDSTGKHHLTDECIKSPDGMIFYVLNVGTDGTYEDSRGRQYPANSASIGCVHEKWIDEKHMDKPGGHWIDFPEPFKCWFDEGGYLNFGNEVRIDQE